MEIQINKEFRDYSEKIYFGLNMRQLVFSALAVAAAAGSYFILRNILPLETLSWLCILIAAPCAVLGFVKYNGMNAEEFIWAYLKSEILTQKRLVFKAEDNLFRENKKNIKRAEKELIKNDEVY